MHGLVNRSIECFLRDTYGSESWAAVAAAAGLGFDSFEAMLTYDDAETDAVLGAAERLLEKDRGAILEDLGTYLVTAPGFDSPRRLLRFGGVSFEEFLHSLDELHDRAKLAVPDLALPQLELRDHGMGRYTLLVHHQRAGFGQVIVGVLRAMADDYGALATLEHLGRKDGVEPIRIELLDNAFARGRSFVLGAAAG